MKKTFTKLVWVLFALLPIVSRSQVYFLNENFSTGTGTTPPAGWTNNTLAGDPSFDKWTFDNPASRTGNSPISSPFAVFDSDWLSSGGGAEDVTLESPAFNTTGYAGVTLKWDQYFQTGFGGRATVEVWDGSTWNQVYDNSTTTTSNPNTQTINITSLAANKTGIKVRFRWRGDYSWWWLIDNVQVYYVVDVAASAVLSPVDRCGKANDNIIVQIKNNSGFSLTNIPVTIEKGGLLGSGTETRTYTRTLNASSTDTLIFPAGSTLAGGALSVKAWTSLTGDNNAGNDTVNYSANFIGTPNNPSNLINGSNCGPGNVVLGASAGVSTDSLYWYQTSSSTTILGSGSTFTTPNIVSTTDFYVEARRGGIGSSISTTFAAGNGQQGAMIDVISTNPVTLDSVTMAIPTNGNYTIGVYYKTGTYVGFETTPSAWTLLGNFNAVSTGSGANTKFDVTNLNLAPSTTYGMYFTIVSGPSTTLSYTNGSNTYTSGGVTINTGKGVSGLFGGTFNPRTWNGTLHFGGGCASGRVAVTATIKPVPSGVTYKAKPGSKGFFYAGSLVDPDVNAVPDRIDFEIVPPTGFANSAFGASGTWNITSVIVETPNGTTVPSSMYSVINPGSSANGEFRLNTDSTFTDSTVCVSIIVKRNDNNCDTTIKRCIYIAPRPKASFTNTSVCLGDITTFTTTSTLLTGALTYQWDLGVSGVTSDLGSPTIQYPAAGSYTVKLVVTSDKGYKDSVTKTINVKQVPVANFNFVNACEGTPLSFTDISTLPVGTPIYEWDFESDGNVDASTASPTHLYNTPNIYRATLTVTVEGCTDSREKYVTQAPRAVPDFTHTALQCDNSEVIFTNASTPPAFGGAGYVWKFGDNTSAAGINTSHTYNGFQTYTVTLVASTELGCKDSIQKNLTLRESPKVDFGITGSACHGDILTFTDNSTVPASATNAYSWDFGDNNTASSQNVDYQFSSPGVRTITLNVMSSNGCEGEKDTTITVNTKPNAGFSASEVCLGQPTTFTNLSFSNDSLSYSWDLDDNFTSTQTTPTVTYTTDGSKDVTLIVTSANGCTDTTTVTAMVNPQPQAQILIASQLSHDGAFAFSTNTPGSKFLWMFGDGGRDSVANTTYKYQFDGMYEVKLIVVTDKGCMDIDTQYLSVNRLGVEDASSLEGNVKMYPNPGNGAFSIAFNGIESADVKSITVTNSLGQVVAELDVRTIANNAIAVNITEQAAGIYFVNVETVNGKVAFKYNLVK